MRWFGCELCVEVESRRRGSSPCSTLGTDEALFEVLGGLDPEDEPLVLTERSTAFAGRQSSDLAGATRLVVPDELIREGRRRPVLDVVKAARQLGIPAVSSSGATLTPAAVARRRLR